MRIGILILLVCFTSFRVDFTNAQTTININPSKDNTLYESGTGDLSNGSGSHLFVGTTNIGEIRRALLYFDITGNIPAGATITDASLSLTMDQTIATTYGISLHTIMNPWGEGASVAGGGGGGGGAAQTNDATWLHTFYPGTFWTSVGGDYNAVASAATNVGGNGQYTWSSPQLLNDVQNWYGSPGANNGWIMIGDEVNFPTAKRFASKENGTASVRPLLSITYTLPPAVVDVGVTALVNPASPTCAGINQTVSVTIMNHESTAINFASNNVTVFVNITGASTQNFNTTLNSGTLGAGASQSVIITNLANLSASGVHTFNASTFTTGDVDTGNDAMVPVDITVNPVWSTGQSFEICAGESITVGSSIYSASGIYTDVFTSIQNGCDSTVTTNLTVLDENTFSWSPSICLGESIVVGTNTYISSGIYTDVLISQVNGCDSTVTTNLTVVEVDTTLTVIDQTISVVTVADSYQWIDCDDNSQINGEMSQSFTPTVDGNYAVIIEQNTCVDTSYCYYIGQNGLDHLNTNNTIKVFPSLNNGVFSILDNGFGVRNIMIYNLMGDLVLFMDITEQKAHVDLDIRKVEKGVYIVKVHNEKETHTEKIIIQ